jgi:ankyrin repeat protein
MTILHIAAKSGTEDVVRKLVRLGANPIAQMEYITPLHIAASDGSGNSSYNPFYLFLKIRYQFCVPIFTSFYVFFSS